MPMPSQLESDRGLISFSICHAVNLRNVFKTEGKDSGRERGGRAKDKRKSTLLCLLSQKISNYLFKKK